MQEISAPKRKKRKSDTILYNLNKTTIYSSLLCVDQHEITKNKITSDVRRNQGIQRETRQTTYTYTCIEKKRCEHGEPVNMPKTQQAKSDQPLTPNDSERAENEPNRPQRHSR